ncbi:hypothetical protein [Nannocystis pusilla]|uniref:Uncharacterized protein n=1 Tax=Nannocystis pusilla TaxID=889268 RepID=A0ABS7TL94_9BACT|nr:hypothetical protein [Nannocystis pusilla]MBZ5708969.1 hypothetical protein [Nannocystis pusilla]
MPNQSHVTSAGTSGSTSQSGAGTGSGSTDERSSAGAGKSSFGSSIPVVTAPLVVTTPLVVAPPLDVTVVDPASLLASVA